ncbi:MAG: TetR/AcrR family transcriptional regulator [Actinomycetota bacterium]|nr:TetR/AcrR family transcriptional regulator [Actinomycetota bacterium]
MTEPVKGRPYRSPIRAAQSAATRDRIIAAARELLTSHGYSGSPVADIARLADVSVDTIYASVGRKPDLVLAVVDDILGEGAGPVPAEQRTYVNALREAPTARAKLATYAAAMARLNPQIAPLLQALVRAGEDDPGCQQAWRRIDERRAANMLLLAADLRVTGQLREDLSDRAVADLIWSTNGWEHFVVLARRDITGDRYATHLTDLWCRVLLDE